MNGLHWALAGIVLLMILVNDVLDIITDDLQKLIFKLLIILLILVLLAVMLKRHKGRSDELTDMVQQEKKT